MKTLTTFINESRTLYSGVMYGTKFQLTNPVNDFVAARDYLVEDDMTQYLKEYLQGDYDELAPKVVHIEWVLNDEESGFIYLIVTEKLNNRDLDIISDWVRGQCSDGLGEGFEQQPFASYEDSNEYYHKYNGYDAEYDMDDDADYIVASFDWETNKYKFKYLGKAKPLR